MSPYCLTDTYSDFFGNKVNSPDSFDIQGNQEERAGIFTAFLEKMTDDAQLNQLQSLGATLTANGKTYAISLHVHGSRTFFTLFDSHGNAKLNSGNQAAFVRVANTPEEVGACLASIVPYIPDPEEEQIEDEIKRYLRDPLTHPSEREAFQKLSSEGQRNLAISLFTEQGQGENNKIGITYVTPKGF